jgi:hypothetical protein
MSRLFSLPPLCPLTAGPEFQRDRRHLRVPHEEVQFEFAEHGARNSKGKGRKPRWDARAAGTACQRRLGRRPRIHRQARDSDARPPPRREMPTPQNLSHRNMQERTPHNCPSPQSKKKKKEKTGKTFSPTKQLTTPTAVCGPGRRQSPSCRERTGGAVVLEGKPRVVTLVVRRNPRSAVPRFQARLRAQRRDARAVGSA